MKKRRSDRGEEIEEHEKEGSERDLFMTCAISVDMTEATFFFFPQPFLIRTRTIWSSLPDSMRAAPGAKPLAFAENLWGYLRRMSCSVAGPHVSAAASFQWLHPPWRPWENRACSRNGGNSRRVESNPDE